MYTMSIDVFSAMVIALTLVGVLLPARKNRLYVVPAAVIFGIPTALLVWFGGLVAGSIAEPLWRTAALGGLVVLHACLLASVLLHFLYRLPPSRWELLYAVPGQVLFVALLAFAPAYGFGSLAGAVDLAPWAVVGGPFALAAYAMASTHTTRLVAENVTVAGLGAPLRIVHLSDMHVGTFMGDWRLGRMAAQINALKPDLVIATGDFVTVRSEKDYSPLLRFFAALERPRLGMYGCLGNHDLPVAKRLVADLEAAGVRMLVNEGETIATAAGDLHIAGLSFFWRDRRKRYRAAFEKAAGGEGPVLLLCHDPAAFDCLPPDWNGIMFAGHLHGGQIGLTSLGLRWSVLKPLGMYDQGVFTRGRAVMYVHRGTGVYGFPVRLGVPAEVALLTLQPAPN